MTSTSAINRPDISRVLNEMKALKSRVEGFKPAGVGDDLSLPGNSSAGQLGPAARTDFSAILANAVDQVNQVQKESGRLAESFQRGDPDATLTDVVIASEKAGVAFEAMTEVRNRLVNAYEDIMNMPI